MLWCRSTGSALVSVYSFLKCSFQWFSVILFSIVVVLLVVFNDFNVLQVSKLLWPLFDCDIFTFLFPCVVFLFITCCLINVLIFQYFQYLCFVVIFNILFSCVWFCLWFLCPTCTFSLTWHFLCVVIRSRIYILKRIKTNSLPQRVDTE